MKLRTTTIAAGLAAALCTGPAFAESGAALSQHLVCGQKHPHKGQRAQIKQAVRSGQISKAEGKQLRQQLKAEKAQRRAMKQSRGQSGYQPSNYSPPQPQ